MADPELYGNFLRGFKKNNLQDVQNFTNNLSYGDIPAPNQPGRTQYDRQFFNTAQNMQPTINQFGQGYNTALSMAGFGEGDFNYGGGTVLRRPPSDDFQGGGGAPTMQAVQTPNGGLQDSQGNTIVPGQQPGGGGNFLNGGLNNPYGGYADYDYINNSDVEGVVENVLNIDPNANLSPRERQARAFGYQGDFGDGGYQEYWSNLSDQRQQKLKQNNPLSDFKTYTNSYTSARPSQQEEIDSRIEMINRNNRQEFLDRQRMQNTGTPSNEPNMGAPDYARDVNPSQLKNVDAEQYMNPYREQVINDTLDDIQQNTQEQNARTRNSAISQGAYGGSRSAILEAENNERMQEQMAQAGAQMRDRGFQSAMDRARFDINNDIQGQRFNQAADLREAGLQQDWFNTAMNQNRRQFNAQNTRAGQLRDAGERERSLQDIEQMNQNRETFFPLEKARLNNQFLSGVPTRNPRDPNSLPSFSDNPFPYLAGGGSLLSGINDLSGGMVTTGIKSIFN